MSKILLITRPNYEHTTRYISKWSEYIISEAGKKSFEIIDLEKEKANKERFLGILSKKIEFKMLVVINGHGNEYEICGQDHKALISTQNTSLLKEKIVYARACSSVRVLGKKAVDDGAVAYIGYDVDFIFFIENENFSRPLLDKTAELFLAPSNYVAIALIKGHSAEEANSRSKNKFRENIKRLLIEGPSSPYYYTIGHLFNNMNHQVCVGEGAAILY